jgi:hypothetical protein
MRALCHSRVTRAALARLLGGEYKLAMSDSGKRCTGGCLCGALRYEADGEPLFAGLCYCDDCRKASGSGFIPFLGFAGSAVRFSGQILTYRSKARSGGDAARNSCPVCGGLVFGGEIANGEVFTIYAGSLDDPSSFHPRVAIFTRNRPAWAVIPPGLAIFEDAPS